MEKTDSCFNCEFCNKNFLRKSSRNRHLREQHLNPSLYQCRQCGSRFSKKYNLQVHIENVHSKNPNQLKCAWCKRVFKKLSTLKTHAKIHEVSSEIKVSSKNESLDNEVDAIMLAKSVLKELQEFQKDIQPARKLFGLGSDVQDISSEENKVKIINIKDNLYPLNHFKIIKAEAIEGADGIIYLKCEFCSKEFKKSYNFLRHRRIHTKVRPFICVLCKKSFPTTSQLKMHCTIHKFDDKFGLFHKMYKCPKCHEGFSNIQVLDKHLSSISSCSNITFKCPQCFKCYKTLKSLLRHKHSEKDNELELLKKIIPCPIVLCNEDKFANDKKNLMECNFCGVQVNQKTLQNYHVKRHEYLFKNQCSKCQCAFASKSSLKIHNKLHTNLTKNFKCQYCYKSFKSEQSCRGHMLTHLKRLLNMHETFLDRNRLLLFPTIFENKNEETVETTTTIIKPVKSCKTKRKEIRTTSSGLKYKCSKCEKAFRYQAWLRKHFKYRHSENVFYKCTNCSKKLRTKQSLESHLLVHSTERTRFTCQVCGKQYASTKSLKVHIRIHTQEKPFNCNKCCKLFRTSGHLIQHRKTNHKE